MKSNIITISIFLIDKLAERNFLTCGIDKELINKGFNVKFYNTADDNIFKKDIISKLIKRIRRAIYANISIRFGTISRFTKNIFKRQHQKDKDLHRHDKMPFRLFVRSKFIYSILWSIYRNLPSCIKPLEGDIFLLTNTQNYYAQAVLKYAEKHNIKVIALVNSWDSLTHGEQVINSPAVKKYLVWNEIHLEEIIKYHRIEKGRIEIIGAISFDALFRKKDQKNELHGIYNIDKNKKIIFFPTYNKRLGKTDPDISKYIAENYKKIDDDFVLIIRPYLFDKTFNERFGDLFNNEKIIIAPCLEDIDDDRNRLSLLLKYSDIVLSGCGTVAIEAFLYDTPVIHVGIDLDERIENTSLFVKFFFSDHYKHIMNKEASFFVRKYEDLIEAVNAYFKDPSTHKEGREKVINEQIYYPDGQVYKRIVDVIVEYLI